MGSMYKQSAIQESKKGIWSFLALTFGFSWLCWIPAAVSGQNAKETLWIIPYILGGFGPSIAGVFLLYRTNRNREERKDFWKRVTNFRLISARWYGIIVLIFPLVFAAAFVANAWLGGKSNSPAMLAMLKDNPLLLIGLIPATLIGGPLSEELGWRGFALDRLQARWNPRVSSLVLGVFWWAWHLPLFFIQGTTQYEIGIVSLEFALFFLNIFPLTFLMTWAYNQNHRSILSAVLLHTAYNYVLSLVFPFPNIQTVFLFAAVLVVIWMEEKKKLEEPD